MMSGQNIALYTAIFLIVLFIINNNQLNHTGQMNLL